MSIARVGRDPVRSPRIAARAVFIDWHGVLSDDLFWWTIVSSPDHWFHADLAGAVHELFTERRSLVESWMRGQATAEEVVATLRGPDDKRCREGYLLRRLRADCARMRVRSTVLDVVRALPPLTLTLIATDNMECFAESAGRIPPLHAFDGVACSSDLGVLKAEDPEAFFGAVLSDHGLEPHHALLVDDSAANCGAFEAWGGTALHFASPGASLLPVVEWAYAVRA